MTQQLKDPFTGRFKRLVAEHTLSDIRSERRCEKETVSECGRRFVTTGKKCSVTFGVKIYKMNGPSVNPLKRYLMLVGVARQNPIDIKDDLELAEETAFEHAMTDPIITVWLPRSLSFDEIEQMILPYYGTMPEKLLKTSKEVKAYNMKQNLKKDAKEREYYQFVIHSKKKEGTNTSCNV